MSSSPFANLNTPIGFDAIAVTPADATDLAYPVRGLLVAVAGTIALVTPAGTALTITAPAGFVPIGAKRILATGTTATGIVGLA